MNWAYIAGFFDGEGSITFRTTKNSLACIVSMAQKDPLVLEAINLFLKRHQIRGYIHEIRSKVHYDKEKKLLVRGEELKSNCYTLQISRHACVSKFLTSVKKYLIVKKTKAELLVQILQEHKDEVGKTEIQPAEIVMWVKEYEQGASTPAIAQKYGHKPATISRVLRLARVEIRHEHSHIPEKEIEQWVELYKNGNSITSIARQFRRSAYTVSDYLRRNGVVIYRTGANRSSVPTRTKYEVGQLPLFSSN